MTNEPCRWRSAAFFALSPYESTLSSIMRNRFSFLFKVSSYVNRILFNSLIVFMAFSFQATLVLAVFRVWSDRWLDRLYKTALHRSSFLLFRSVLLKTDLLPCQLVLADSFVPFVRLGVRPTKGHIDSVSFLIQEIWRSTHIFFVWFELILPIFRLISPLYAAFLCFWADLSRRYRVSGLG